MPDKVYCYPNSDVLVNKLNIQDSRDLFEAEKKLTYIRLKELQDNPIKGDFNFDHLREIHKYIFQDLKISQKTVDIPTPNAYNSNVKRNRNSSGQGDTEAILL